MRSPGGQAYTSCRARRNRAGMEDSTKDQCGRGQGSTNSFGFWISRQSHLDYTSSLCISSGLRPTHGTTTVPSSGGTSDHHSVQGSTKEPKSSQIHRVCTSTMESGVVALVPMGTRITLESKSDGRDRTAQLASDTSLTRSGAFAPAVDGRPRPLELPPVTHESAAGDQGGSFYVQ